jgi:hypothetical protein
MILRVGHIKISMGVQSDAPWVAKLAGGAPCLSNYLQRPIVCIKNLNATVAKLTHKLSPFGVHNNVVGIAQVTGAGSRFAVEPLEFSTGREYLNAVIAGICNIDPVVCIHSYSLGAIELARGNSGGAPRIEAFPSVSRKLLHAVDQGVFAHEHASLCIHSDGTGQREFSNIRPMDTPPRHESALGREMVYALVMGFEDDDVSVAIATHPLGFAEVGLRHLPRK